MVLAIVLVSDEKLLLKHSLGFNLVILRRRKSGNRRDFIMKRLCSRNIITQTLV